MYRNDSASAPASDTSQRSTPTVSPGKVPLTHRVQRFARGTEAAPAFEHTPASGGSALPAPVQAKMSDAFGADFSDVRVHQDGQAEAAGAHAYATGNDLHFASGQYDPGSESGQVLIAHELSHVVQQRQGRVGGEGVVNDQGLESEADDHGARAVRGEKLAVGGAGSAVQRKVVQREAADEGGEGEGEGAESPIAVRGETELLPEAEVPTPYGTFSFGASLLGAKTVGDPAFDANKKTLASELHEAFPALFATATLNDKGGQDYWLGFSGELGQFGPVKYSVSFTLLDLELEPGKTPKFSIGAVDMREELPIPAPFGIEGALEVVISFQPNWVAIGNLLLDGELAGEAAVEAGAEGAAEAEGGGLIELVTGISGPFLFIGTLEALAFCEVFKWAMDANEAEAKRIAGKSWYASSFVETATAAVFPVYSAHLGTVMAEDQETATALAQARDKGAADGRSAIATADQSQVSLIRSGGDVDGFKTALRQQFGDFFA